MVKKQINKLILKYISLLKENNYSVCKAYIFGSQVNGMTDKNSDIDIAIIMNNLENSFQTQVDMIKLIKNVDYRIEPHPFNEADFNQSNPMANEIMTTGIRII